jgi:hypothetical protein
VQDGAALLAGVRRQCGRARRRTWVSGNFAIQPWTGLVEAAKKGPLMPGADRTFAGDTRRENTGAIIDAARARRG